MSKNLIKRLFEHAKKMGLTKDLSSLSGLDKGRITVDSSAMYQGLENEPNRNVDGLINAFSSEQE